MGATPLWVSIPFAIFLVAASAVFVVFVIALISDQRDRHG